MYVIQITLELTIFQKIIFKKFKILNCRFLSKLKKQNILFSKITIVLYHQIDFSLQWKCYF